MKGQYQIRLASGITIELNSIYQYRTYSCLLEGLPTRQLNRMIVEKAKGYAIEKLWFGGGPYLIQPPEIPINVPRQKWLEPDEEYEPARIPPIACIALFDALAIARDPNADSSALRIVWFQDDFALPIDPTTIAQIQQIDWKIHAEDGYW